MTECGSWKRKSQLETLTGKRWNKQNEGVVRSGLLTAGCYEVYHVVQHPEELMCLRPWG